jgi:hypothetical protein
VKKCNFNTIWSFLIKKAPKKAKKAKIALSCLAKMEEHHELCPYHGTRAFKAQIPP